MKITFNSPFILTFGIIATCILAISLSMQSSINLFVLHGNFSASNFSDYVGLLLYPINHASMQHLVSNFAIILLLGPILEKQYGWQRLLGLSIITTLVIGIVHILISDSDLIGASGIVFMFIVLASLANSAGKEIPLTFILVVVLFLGQEIVGSFKDDNVSQMAHICGGIMAIIYRYFLK